MTISLIDAHPAFLYLFLDILLYPFYQLMYARLSFRGLNAPFSAFTWCFHGLSIPTRFVWILIIFTPNDRHYT